MGTEGGDRDRDCEDMGWGEKQGLVRTEGGDRDRDCEDRGWG